MKTTTLGTFLTESEINQCIKLRRAPAICEEVIRPNMERINNILGQENEPMYLAYMAEFVVSLKGPHEQPH